MNQNIVITGATGQLGRLTITHLLTAGVPADTITAIARSREKAADLAAQGIRVHLADYDQPETLTGAFSAGDRVLLISGSEVGKRIPQHAAVIDAAKAAGVAQLAYTSVFGGPNADFLLADEHRQTEELILDSGLPYTFLRNNWYTEMLTGELAGILERGAIVNSVAADARLATAPRTDYAQAAAMVLRDDGHLGRAYELGGDTAWSFGEFADEISRQTGKTVMHTIVTPEAQRDSLTSAGIPPAFADILNDVDAAISRGALAATPGDLSRLIERPTTPLAATIAAILASP
jgi:NAD(P)H dehydrogenase (quinone)